MALSSEQQRVLTRRIKDRLAEQADRAGSAAGKLWGNTMNTVRGDLDGDLGDALYRTLYSDLTGWNEFRATSNALWERSRIQAIRTSSAAHSLRAGLPVVAIDPVMVPGVPPSGSVAMRAVREALQAGLEWSEAVEIGRLKMEGLHRSAVHEAARRSGDVWAERVGYRGGWVRVLVGPSCDWCALVSTQVYRSASSASFGHDNCDCEVAPSGKAGTQLLERLRDDGVVDRITRSRNTKRALEQANNAEQQSIAAMAEARLEPDLVRRERIIARARKWDARAHGYRVKAAETVAHPIPESHTGYVNPDGSPAPRPAA